MEMKQYPILEFDESRDAVINPSNLIKPIEGCERCVITFSGMPLKSWTQKES